MRKNSILNGFERMMIINQKLKTNNRMEQSVNKIITIKLDEIIGKF